MTDFAEPYDASRAQPMPQEPSPVARFLGLQDYSLAQRIENKKRGVGKQRYPVVGESINSSCSHYPN